MLGLRRWMGVPALSGSGAVCLGRRLTGTTASSGGDGASTAGASGTPGNDSASANASSTTTTTTSRARKIQIAVVGSGPSGCFVASYLTKKNPAIHVDVLERMPVPYGLCRYGVAPDHPDVKNVEKQFLELFKSGAVTWIGNVTVGKDVPVSALLEHYAAVVFATGADESKKLGIPGEDLSGVHSARDFVAYYNTLPFPYGSPRFCPFDLERARRVAVVGNGNVAMDVVRVLAGSYKYFCPTDMNCVALKELMKNRISDISVVARRGAEHSAFAIAEFRELTTYQPGTVTVRADHFDLEAAVAAPGVARTARAQKRLMELVHKHALSAADTAAGDAAMACTADGAPLLAGAGQQQQPPQRSSSSSPTASGVAGGEGAVTRPPCAIHFRYRWTPVRFVPHPQRRNYVGGVLLRRTAPATDGGTAAAAEYALLPCDVVFTSVGYRSDGVDGVPFDHARGVMPNARGRVAGAPRVYCAGWVKNGAKGVILHSVVDAQETAAAVLEDIERGAIPTTATEAAGEQEPAAAAEPPAGEPEVRAMLPEADAPPDVGTTTMQGKYGLIDYFLAKRMQPVSVAGLERILYVERERGVDLGKSAEKMDSVRDMLDVALGGEVGAKTNERVRGIAPARPDAMMYLKELLDDDTDLAPLAHELAKDLPRRLAAEHPPGPIAPSQL